ncbi:MULTISPECIES: thiamine pyrophosphate-dependent enzyme [Aliarcobacter]|uniref:thiamine pyrophosphate-dependent enzyme n=1 Tax=Aliarcobacter TaxID=2321111 RepID=UPI00125F207C|nr:MULTISPECIES: thiamine pyrophosphate-dependent enzyme [Aliarcobacter]MCT7481223.1 thiamine pyrophosphate-dependent enzyme [Aliarcobacter cryaerophilus]MCT7537892.1 thiamine pyrophosphate-dependent enzyme [Aliarcobacter butzleri]MCT7624868.1 thiamine pyrophosphate-dependent enzyme [Aliarcobacter butzleri]MCT7626845.1 thiamine pyrophosphate-dependent enzyme [Aliarcobacter butzleri]MCT7630172.1 thiamine pyrophosphate-dependent enzyme [Aliarcobacter butzleri]
MALDTKLFINRLIEKGYTHLCVVPCSFAKYVINEAINNPNIEYLPSASEAVACSIAAGLKMAGKKPIVIVQSSGVTNMGSCITSLLKPYSVTFPILSSWRTYKFPDSEIQHQHLATELPTLINAYGYESQIIDNEDIDNAINQIELCDTSFTIGIIKKDSFTKVELDNTHKLDLSNYTPRSEFLITLNNLFKNNDTLFIGTTGNTAREMYSFMKDTNNFYMAGNMGGALSLGLGAAKVGKKVIVCGGDAEFVMHMGGLSTAGRYKDKIDLTYILFDNESNKSTGGQNTYQSHINYIAITKACGFNVSEDIVYDIEELEQKIKNAKGLNFIHVKCGIDDETPRPPIEVVKVSKFK